MSVLIEEESETLNDVSIEPSLNVREAIKYASIIVFCTILLFTLAWCWWYGYLPI